MSCAVMYQPYSVSPYLPPPPAPNVTGLTSFDRLPVSASSASSPDPAKPLSLASHPSSHSSHNRPPPEKKFKLDPDQHQHQQQQHGQGCGGGDVYGHHMRHSSPLSQPSASPASPLRVGPSSRPDSALNSSENHHETHLNLSLHSSSSHHHNVTGQSSPDAKSGSNPERRKSDDLNNIDDDGDGDDDVEPFVGRAQYLSTNLILITNYNGDTQAIVDDHFSRALGTGGPRFNEENSEKASTPLSERNLPASFWNSNARLQHYHYHHQTPSYAADLYTPDQFQTGLSLHHLAAATCAAADWQQYSSQTGFSAAQTGFPRTSAHHYGSAAAYSSRFPQSASASYWAAASRLAGSSVKGDWPPAASGDYHAAAAALQGASGLHATAGDFSHAYGTAAAAAAAHHYSNMAGLDSVQEASKDLYWPATF